MRRVILIILCVTTLLIVIAVMVSRRPSIEEAKDTQHITFEIPPGRSYGGAATGRQLDISPDGTRIVYVGTELSERWLYLQPIAGPAATAIPGTVHGSDPSFAPDGRRIAFYADGTVKIVTLESGEMTSVGK